MNSLYTINLWIHVVFACLALTLFWVPIFTKKGQLNHKRFGHWYKIAMYTVAASGVVMASMIFNREFGLGAEFSASEQTAAILSNVQQFALFLIYLALLMFTTTRHGIAVLIAKEKRNKLRVVNYLIPVLCLLVFGVALFIFGLFSANTLHIVFGILGGVLSVGMLRYCYRETVARNTWLLEHIGSMIGSGIAAYTAFLTFGGRTLFSDLGQWQLVLWIAPGVIGGFASYLVCKHYARLFYIGAPSSARANASANARRNASTHASTNAN